MGSGLSAEMLVQELNQGADVKREAVLRSICDQAGTNEDKREELVKASAIDPLVKLLKDKDAKDKEKELAAGALGHLAMNPDAKSEIAEASGIDILVNFVKDGDSGIRGAAATAVGHLASKSPKNQAKIAELGAIEALTRMVKDKELGVQPRCWASAALGNVALQNEANQERVAEAGAITAICELLAQIVPKIPHEEPPGGPFKSCGGCRKRNRPLADLEAPEKAKGWLTRALSSLGYMCEKNQLRIAQAGGYEPIVEIIKGDDTQSRMEAISTLLNLVGKHHETKTRLAKTGVIPVIVNELAHEGTSMNRKAKCTGLLAVLATGYKENAEQIVACNGIQPIVWQTHTGTDEAKLYAAMAICMMAEAGSELQSKLGEGGATLGIGKLVEGGNAQQRHWSAKALMALAKDHPENRARIEAHGGALPSEEALRGMKIEGLKMTRVEASEAPSVADGEDSKDKESAGPELPPHLVAKAAATPTSEAGEPIADEPALGDEGARRRPGAGGADDD